MRYCEIKIELASESSVAVHTLLVDRQLSFHEADASTLDPPPPGRTRYFLYVSEEEREQIPPILEAVREVVPAAEIDMRDRDEDEWRDVWKRYFSTRRVGRLAIVPSWEVEAHVPSEGEVTLQLDPGRAFGTGGHESTRLCMQMLDRLTARLSWRVGLFARLGERLRGRGAQGSGGAARSSDDAIETTGPVTVAPQILDVGCGSGVLAIAALRLWPETTAIAIDIDPEAIEVTLENAERNGVLSRLLCETTPLADIKTTFAIVLANLTGPTLIEHCAALCAHVEPGGVIILSGILEAEVQTVQASFLAQGLVETTRATDGEWASLEFLRPAATAGFLSGLGPKHR